jgi:hypothetical protein
VPGLLKSIAQNPESRWTFDPSEEYNHAFWTKLESAGL